MKRIGGIAAIVALAVAAPSAFGLSRVLLWRAPTGNEGIDLQFNIKKGHATKITRFEFNNIPVFCPPYRSAVSDSFAHAIKVSSKGKFHAVEKTNGGRTTYTMSGHFVTLHKAVGKLRIKGSVPGCSNTDTGTIPWTAKG